MCIRLLISNVCRLFHILCAPAFNALPIVDYFLCLYIYIAWIILKLGLLDIYKRQFVLSVSKLIFPFLKCNGSLRPFCEACLLRAFVDYVMDCLFVWFESLLNWIFMKLRRADFCYVSYNFFKFLMQILLRKEEGWSENCHFQRYVICERPLRIPWVNVI